MIFCNFSLHKKFPIVQSNYYLSLPGFKRGNAALNSKELLEVFEWLVQLLEGGIALETALRFLQGAQLSQKARVFVALALEHMRSGKPFSQALTIVDGGPKNAALSTLILAGEEGGFLTLSLQKACQLLSKELKLRSSASAQLAYPLFLATLCSALAGFFLVVIAPMLEPLFAGQAGASSALFALSRGLRQWGLTSFMCSAAITAVLALAWKTRAGCELIRKSTRRVPVLSSIARERALLWLFQTLALLVQARIDLPRALALICELAGGNVYEREWRSLQALVSQGALLSDVLARQRGVAKLAVDLLALGELTGDLTGALERVARFYEHRHFKRLERCARYLQPALLLLVSVLVAFMTWLVLEPLTAIHQLTLAN